MATIAHPTGGHLLEGLRPALLDDRRRRGTADMVVVVLSAAALLCTLATVLGSSGPDGFMDAAAPALGLGLLINALLGMWFERYRDGFARLLLAASALAFFVLAATYAGAYVGTVEPWRVIVGCLAPALLSAVGAVVLSEERRVERQHSA